MRRRLGPQDRPPPNLGMLLANLDGAVAAEMQSIGVSAASARHESVDGTRPSSRGWSYSGTGTSDHCQGPPLNGSRRTNRSGLPPRRQRPPPKRDPPDEPKEPPTGAPATTIKTGPAGRTRAGSQSRRLFNLGRDWPKERGILCITSPSASSRYGPSLKATRNRHDNRVSG